MALGVPRETALASGRLGDGDRVVHGCALPPRWNNGPDSRPECNGVFYEHALRLRAGVKGVLHILDGEPGAESCYRRSRHNLRLYSRQAERNWLMQYGEPATLMLEDRKP